VGSKTFPEDCIVADEKHQFLEPFHHFTLKRKATVFLVGYD